MESVYSCPWLALLEAGATVNARNKLLQTALHVAAERRHHAVAQALLSAGRTTERKTSNRTTQDHEDENERTALHLAAMHGHDATVQCRLMRSQDLRSVAQLLLSATRTSTLWTMGVTHLWIGPRTYIATWSRRQHASKEFHTLSERERALVR